MQGVSWALDPGVLLGRGGKVLPRLLPARVTQGANPRSLRLAARCSFRLSSLRFLLQGSLFNISKVKLKHKHTQIAPPPTSSFSVAIPATLVN